MHKRCHAKGIRLVDEEPRLHLKQKKQHIGERDSAPALFPTLKFILKVEILLEHGIIKKKYTQHGAAHNAAVAAQGPTPVASPTARR